MLGWESRKGDTKEDLEGSNNISPNFGSREIVID